MKQKTTYIAVYSSYRGVLFALIDDNDDVFAIHSCDNSQEELLQEAKNIYDYAHGVDPLDRIISISINKKGIMAINSKLGELPEFFVFVGSPEADFKKQVVSSNNSLSILMYCDLYDAQPGTAGLRMLSAAYDLDKVH